MESFKIPLVAEKKEGYLLLLISLLLISFHLAYIYKKYIFFRNSPFILTEAEVISVYRDNGDYRKRLKCYSCKTGYFYTQIGKDEVSVGDKIRLFVYPKQELSFLEFLRGTSYSTKIASYNSSKNSFTDKVARWIAKQHKSQELTNFYQAIYLAFPLDKRLRKQISAFGINHLTALSGFHLGIISSVILLLITPVYKYFQKKYFPYRNRYTDIGAIVLLILYAYIYMTGYPPSLLRAYSMMAVGWLALAGGIEIFSFTTLATAVLLLLIFMPHFIVSKAFWLSVAGVMYIFILLKAFGNFHSRLVKLILLPIGIFVMMSPVVHSIFPETTIYQLFSPVLSVIFVIFYPLSIVLHITGYGGLFDGLLMKLFASDITVAYVNTPQWLTIIYIILSILSIYRRYMFLPLSVFALFSISYTYLSII